MTFQPSELVGLGPLAKWRHLLTTLYGVTDLRVAHAYLKRAERLSLDLESGLVAGLNIAPALEAARPASPMRPRDLFRRASALGLPETHLRGRAPPSVWREASSEETDQADTLAAYAGRAISPIDYSRYFERPKKASEMQMQGRVGKLDGRHVILVRSQDLGLLSGPGITFLGKPVGRHEHEFHPGFVMYGPKADFEPGEYELEVDIEGPSDGCITLEVVSHGGLQKLLSLNLVGSTKLTCRFDINDSDSEVEIRIINSQSEHSNYRVNRVFLIRTERGD